MALLGGGGGEGSAVFSPHGPGIPPCPPPGREACNAVRQAVVKGPVGGAPACLFCTPGEKNHHLSPLSLFLASQPGRSCQRPPSPVFLPMVVSICGP